jgi:hypothetical protein
MDSYCFDEVLRCVDCLASNCIFAIFSNGASICTNNRSLLNGEIFKELEQGGERLCPVEVESLPSIIVENSWGPSDYGNIHCISYFIIHYEDIIRHIYPQAF